MELPGVCDLAACAATPTPQLAEPVGGIIARFGTASVYEAKGRLDRAPILSFELKKTASIKPIRVTSLLLMIPVT